MCRLKEEGGGGGANAVEGNEYSGWDIDGWVGNDVM